jgi:hypothetical protein
MNNTFIAVKHIICKLRSGTVDKRPPISRHITVAGALLDQELLLNGT